MKEHKPTTVFIIIVTLLIIISIVSAMTKQAMKHNSRGSSTPKTYSSYSGSNHSYYKKPTYKNDSKETRTPAVTHSNTGYQSSKKKTTTADPYNAKSYANEDEFWEDYYNDFIDYDEAEQYYFEFGE